MSLHALSPAPQIMEQTELLKQLAAAQAEQSAKTHKVAIWALVVSVATLAVAVLGIWATLLT